MNRIALLFAATAAIAMCTPAPPPPRVLIVTGQSDIQYHDWRATTGMIETMLRNAGFEVRRMEDPHGLTSQTLGGYDAVFLSYNGPRWGPGPESALEEFVRSGRGLVSIHGVTYGPLMGTIMRPGGGWDTAEPWAGFADMLGVTWAPKNIGHAARHAFRVKIADPEHPITRGMPAEFTVNDELYHRMTHRPGIHVLATAFDDPSRGGTGQNEPIAWTNSYGKGRVFHCTLGHDTSALYEPSVLALLARATQWVSRGEVNLPPAVVLEQRPKDAVRVLVVTGGHSYDPSFYRVFDSFQDVTWSHATSQKEAFAPGMKDKWDVVVLYDMHNEIGDAEWMNLYEYVQAGKGLVALHHSIVDYTSWPLWYEEVIGGKYYEKPEGDHPASHYKDDQPMVLRPVRGAENHPILRGVGEIVTVDECYRGMWHSPKIQVLMETDNPLNDPPMVYIGPTPGLRAVYIQLGHGTYTHNHPGYRTLVHNAILWSAGRAK
jgi:type 1 glutamine amidotransferase